MALIRFASVFVACRLASVFVCAGVAHVAGDMLCLTVWLVAARASTPSRHELGVRKRTNPLIVSISVTMYITSCAADGLMM